MIPVYIGTYTRRESFVDGKGRGIYIFHMDPATGELEFRSLVSGLVNPSFISIAARKGFFYAVNEIAGGSGASGAVSAFTIDALTAEISFLNEQSTHGFAPCHVSVDGSEGYVLVANYASGSISVLPIRADGSLGEATHVVQHVGSGPVRQRQSGPHAHMIIESPDGGTVLAVDLGTDEIFAYRLDAEHGVLVPTDSPSTKLAPGTGPRHLSYHNNGRYAYVNGELNSTITVFDYDPLSGALRETQTISTLPDGFNGRSTAAAIQVHPSGKFLYASNRGHNSIAIYEVDESNGLLFLVGHQPCGGRIPRHFTIDQTGDFLLVANQNSDSVVTFRINPATGELSAEHMVEVPTPVCIKIHPSFGDLEKR